MAITFDNLAALMPYLGTFGKTVTLPDDSEVPAIVDYVEFTEESASGLQVRLVSWHFTVYAPSAVGIKNGDPIIYDGHTHRVRHCLPDGQRLATLYCTRAPD